MSAGKQGKTMALDEEQRERVRRGLSDVAEEIDGPPLPPLDPQLEQRLIALVKGQRQPMGESRPEAPVTDLGQWRASLAPPRRRSPLLVGLQRGASIAAALAVALLAALVIPMVAPRVPPLPYFTIEFGGEAQLLSSSSGGATAGPLGGHRPGLEHGAPSIEAAPSEIYQWREKTRLSITLRPQARHGREIEAAVYGQPAEGGALVRWSSEGKCDGGVCQLAITPKQLALKTGRWKMLIAVAWRGSLPSPAELGGVLLHGPGWRVEKTQLVEIVLDSTGQRQ